MKKNIVRDYRRIELMKGISNNKQSMWLWIIFSILLCWTIIAPIIGIIFACISHSMKTKKEIELALLNG